MASIVRMILVLSLLCASSGFILSYLKMTTAGRIEEQVLTYVQGPALAQVFPDAENIPLVERHVFTLPDGRNVTVFPEAGSCTASLWKTARPASAEISAC